MNHLIAVGFPGVQTVVQGGTPAHILVVRASSRIHSRVRCVSKISSERRRKGDAREREQDEERLESHLDLLLLFRRHGGREMGLDGLRDLDQPFGKAFPGFPGMPRQFGSKCRDDTAALGMLAVAVPHVVTDPGLEAALFDALVEIGDRAVAGFIDGGPDQFLLGREVAVKPPMGEAGFGHEIGHADLVNTVFAKAGGGDFHNTVSRGFLMSFFVAHDQVPGWLFGLKTYCITIIILYVDRNAIDFSSFLLSP